MPAFTENTLFTDSSSDSDWSDILVPNSPEPSEDEEPLFMFPPRPPTPYPHHVITIPDSDEDLSIDYEEDDSDIEAHGPTQNEIPPASCSARPYRWLYQQFRLAIQDLIHHRTWPAIIPDPEHADEFHHCLNLLTNITQGRRIADNLELYSLYTLGERINQFTERDPELNNPRSISIFLGIPEQRQKEAIKTYVLFEGFKECIPYLSHVTAEQVALMPFCCTEWINDEITFEYSYLRV